MPAFFVHGVPNTAHLWDDVRAHLRRTDVIAPSMPGFGSIVPEGFDCAKEAYIAWLIAQIETVGEPVDLVAHDWGCLLAQRLVSQRPELVRTWAAGGAPLDTEYVWHPMAQAWQTIGVGEQVMAALSPDAMTGALVQQGIAPDTARGMTSHFDDRMKSSILALYRSATRIAEDWTPLLAPVPPGLVLWGADDPYAGPAFGRRLAERTGAKITVFEGCGHWWPLQRAAETAELLEAHWR